MEMLGRVLKGQYLVESVLGEGGMGIVYRGQHRSLHKPVAIKTLHPSAFRQEKKRQRFQREALLASKILHPGVAQVFDFGIEDDTPFLVMEFIEGPELTELIHKEAPLAPARVLIIMRQLAAVLKEAERQGLVHRDIKPQNIRLVHQLGDGPLVIKVLDFGIAKELLVDEQGGLTSTGSMMGTPHYCSPEQINGTSEVLDGRADQYSAGVLCYELLAGRVPFPGSTVQRVLFSHLQSPPPPLPDTVPRRLRQVVQRMLAKKKEKRFANVEALDQALAQCESVCRDAPAASREENCLTPDASTPWRKQLFFWLAVSGGSAAFLSAGFIAVAQKRIHQMPLVQRNSTQAVELQDRLPAQEKAPIRMGKAAISMADAAVTESSNGSLPPNSASPVLTLHAASIDSLDAANIERSAQNALDRGNPTQAIRLLGPLSALRPRRPATYSVLCRAYEALGQPQKAATACRAVGIPVKVVTPTVVPGPAKIAPEQSIPNRSIETEKEPQVDYLR